MYESTEVIPRQNPTNRCCNFAILTKSEVTILLLGTIGIVIAFAMAIVTLVISKNEEDRIFSIMVIVATVMTLAYLYRGIFGERAYELLIYVISAIFLLFYVIINFASSLQNQSLTKSIKIIKYVRLVSSVVIVPITSVIGCILAYNYNIRGNLIFRTVGGLEQLQDACKNLFLFEAILWLDLQLQIGSYIVVLGLGESFDKIHYIVLGVGPVFGILWTLLGFLSMRQESNKGVTLFCVLGLLEPAYIIYLLYYAFDTVINANMNPVISPINPIISVTFAACLMGLAIRICLFILIRIVQSNFKKGLKYKMSVFSKDKNQETRPLLNGSSSDLGQA